MLGQGMRERWRVCCRRRRKSALCQGDTHFQRRPHLCTHWPVSQPGVVVCTRIFPRGAAMSGFLDGGREGNEASGEILLCHVVLYRWLISFCFDRSVSFNRRVMVESSFFFPRGRERTRFVGNFASLLLCCFAFGSGHEGGCWWCVLVPVLPVCLAAQFARPGPVLSLWGVVEEEGESCQGYMLMASMISPGRELHEFLRSRRRDNFDGSVSRGLDAGVNVMLTS
jgi:hypothetical protein